MRGILGCQQLDLLSASAIVILGSGDRAYVTRNAKAKAGRHLYRITE